MKTVAHQTNEQTPQNKQIHANTVKYAKHKTIRGLANTRRYLADTLICEASARFCPVGIRERRRKPSCVRPTNAQGSELSRLRTEPEFGLGIALHLAWLDQTCLKWALAEAGAKVETVVPWTDVGFRCKCSNRSQQPLSEEKRAAIACREFRPRRREGFYGAGVQDGSFNCWVGTFFIVFPQQPELVSSAQIGSGLLLFSFQVATFLMSFYFVFWQRCEDLLSQPRLTCGFHFKTLVVVGGNEPLRSVGPTEQGWEFYRYWAETA